jgi:hypothetical protein
MRKVAFLLFFLFLIFPQNVFAHGAGLPPFFKINGVIANAYPIQSASPLFTVPQDLAPANYVKDTNITFEIDTQALSAVFADDVLKSTKYEWDFGDGTKGTGAKNVHKYSKIGSVVLSVTASFPNQQADAVLIESVMLQILPDKDFKLPQAVIFANDKEVKNPLKDQVDVDLNNSVTLDASKSKAPSSKIVSFEWDFSDSRKSNKATTTHRYKLPQYYISPAVRITDDKGFIIDTSVNLRNSGKNDENNVEPTDDMAGSIPISLISEIGAVIF